MPPHPPLGLGNILSAIILGTSRCQLELATRCKFQDTKSHNKRGHKGWWEVYYLFSPFSTASSALLQLMLFAHWDSKLILDQIKKWHFLCSCLLLSISLCLRTAIGSNRRTIQRVERHHWGQFKDSSMQQYYMLILRMFRFESVKRLLEFQ